MPKASALSFLGIAKEATPGTSVASTNYIPVKSITPQDVVGYQPDEGMRASMAKTYGDVQVTTSSTFGYGGDVFADSIGWPIAGILGNVATTGSGAPYSHAIALLNSGDGQPTSYTLNDNYVAANRRYPGQKHTDVDFTFSSEGLLTYSAKATGYPSATASAPTASFTAVTPSPSWIGVLTIGGSAVSTAFDGSLSIKRSVQVIHTLQNSQTPYKVFVGALAVTGKLTFIMDDDTELTRYLTDTKPSLDIDFQQGASSALTEVKFHMTKVAYTNVTIDRGKDFIAASANFEAIANTTDVGASGGYSPIKVTLQNALAASVYV